MKNPVFTPVVEKLDGTRVFQGPIALPMAEAAAGAVINLLGHLDGSATSAEMSLIEIYLSEVRETVRTLPEEEYELGMGLVPLHVRDYLVTVELVVD